MTACKGLCPTHLASETAVVRLPKVDLLGAVPVAITLKQRSWLVIEGCQGRTPLMTSFVQLGLETSRAFRVWARLLRCLLISGKRLGAKGSRLVLALQALR